jgi:DNA-binding PucR family transcriptional regulator
VVGHPVPLEHLPASVRIAEVAATLQRSGVITEDPVFADEHLDAIIVHRDPRLLEALRRQVLEPLDRQSPGTRARLTETLASWLRHQGDRQAVAAELHIHPQTVRYRLTQLHELFGSALDDPATRARLTLALAWGPTDAPA